MCVWNVSSCLQLCRRLAWFGMKCNVCNVRIGDWYNDFAFPFVCNSFMYVFCLLACLFVCLFACACFLFVCSLACLLASLFACLCVCLLICLWSVSFLRSISNHQYHILLSQTGCYWNTVFSSNNCLAVSLVFNLVTLVCLTIFYSFFLSVWSIAAAQLNLSIYAQFHCSVLSD